MVRRLVRGQGTGHVGMSAPYAPPSETKCQSYPTASRPNEVARVPHSVKIRDVRCVMAVWNFNKLNHEQDPSVIDLGEELLIPHKKGQHCLYKNQRAQAVRGALDEFVRRILTMHGCRMFEYNGKNCIAYCKGAAPKPKLPDWLDVPYIIFKEDINLWADLSRNIEAGQRSLREPNEVAALRQSVHV
jgi:hypothetical protein